MSITFTNLTGDWRRIVEDYITDPENVSDTPGVQGTITVTPLLGEGRHAPKGVPTDSVFYTLEALDLQVYRGLLRDQNMNADITVATDIDGYPIAWRAKFDLQYRRQRIPLNDVIFGPGEIVDGKISLSSLVARDGVPPEYEGSYQQLMDAVRAAADSADAAARSASEAADTAASVGQAADTVNEHIDEILAAPDHAQAAADSASAAADDRAQTGLDREQTGLDRTATGEDRVQTGQDRDATAADRVATGEDREQTGIDRAAAEQSAADAAVSAGDALTEAGRAGSEADRAQQYAEDFDLTATSSTGDPGTDAGVTVTGVGPAYGLAFTIPRGDKGDTGPAGEVSQATLDAAVASLVDGAPEALNTLDELASALGNDPNFATTTSEAIGRRAKIDGAPEAYDSLGKLVSAILAGDLGGVADWGDLTGKPSAFPPESHEHSWSEVTGKPSTFPPTIGTTSSTAKAGDYVPAWSEVTGKPSEFPPSSHTHAIADVSGLQDALDDAASSGAGVEVMTRAAFDQITPDPEVVYLVTEG